MNRQFETCAACGKKRCGEIYAGTRIYWNYKVCNKCLDSQDPTIIQKVEDYDKQFRAVPHKDNDISGAKAKFEALKK